MADYRSPAHLFDAKRFYKHDLQTGIRTFTAARQCRNFTGLPLFLSRPRQTTLQGCSSIGVSLTHLAQGGNPFAGGFAEQRPDSPQGRLPMVNWYASGFNRRGYRLKWSGMFGRNPPSHPIPVVNLPAWLASQRDEFKFSWVQAGFRSERLTRLLIFVPRNDSRSIFGGHTPINVFGRGWE